MDEGELLQWDLVPPDLGSSDLFFTEESYKNVSVETDFTEQILSKFKELGPYSYTTDKDLTDLNFDKKSETMSSCQISPDPGSKVSLGDLESNHDVHANIVKDSTAENGSTSPESMEPVSECVREIPSSCENSLKSVSAPPPEEHSQNMLYGRKRMQYPRHSLLSNPDQVFYLSKFIEYKKKQPERGCRQYARFLQLHKKVQKEQEEFAEYLQKVSLEFKEDYAFLQEVAAEYMQKKHEANLKRLQEYNPFCFPIDKVPISTNQRTAHELKPVKILLQMGEVPVSFQFPKTKIQTVLDYEILQKKFPTEKPQSAKNESPFYDHRVCSEDVNAQRLAQKYQCHIVVSSSVLKCLVDNHAPHFEKCWDVPINIQEYQLEGSEKADHKVVFLDKPFYRQQTTRDVNATFHKVSLAARILHPNHVSRHMFHPGSTLHKRSVSDDRPVNDALSEEFSIMDDSALETFGTSTSHTSFGTVTKKPVASKGNSVENPRLESGVCDRKDANEDLPEKSVLHRVEGCSDLKPAELTSETEDSLPQVFPSLRLSDENGSEEKSKMGLISENPFKSVTENSDQIESNSSDKELLELNQNESQNNQPDRNLINENDSSDPGSLDQKEDCPGGETDSFENTLKGETVSDEDGEKTNVQENEKPPSGVKMKINDEIIDVSVKTTFCISKEESSEDGDDSDSSSELIIDFESSNTDDKEEKQPEGIKIKISDGAKIPNVNAEGKDEEIMPGGIEIKINDDAIPDVNTEGKDEEKPPGRIEIKMNIDCDDDRIPDASAEGKEEEIMPGGIEIKINDDAIPDINTEGKEEEIMPGGIEIKMNTDCDDDRISDASAEGKEEEIMPAGIEIKINDDAILDINTEGKEEEIMPGGIEIKMNTDCDDDRISDASAEGKEEEIMPGGIDIKINDDAIPDINTEGKEEEIMPGGIEIKINDDVIPDVNTEGKEEEKMPGEIEINNNEDGISAAGKEIKMASCIPKERFSKDEDALNSSTEVIIDLKSSNTDNKEEEKVPEIMEINMNNDDDDDDDERIPDVNIEDKQEEKTPGGNEIKIDDSETVVDVSSKDKEIKTAFYISNEKSSEDGDDSDSSTELIIDFESSNTDDTSEKKSIHDKTKKSIPDTQGSPIRDALGSPITDAPASPRPDAPASPRPDAPASPIPDAPGSPIPDAPGSPIPDAPGSPIPDAPGSPIPDAPASPIPDAPGSPIPDTPSSPSLLAKQNCSQMFDRPLVIIPTESDENVFTFDEIQPQNPNISESTPARVPKKRRHQTAFVPGPLDSILEKQEELLKTSQMKSENTGTKTTIAIPEMKSNLKQLDDNFYETKSADNPEDYLQPEEGKNVSYCIWNLGDLRLLVRCKYSSIRKAKRKKDFVYVMPKLEYQVGFGHEQTTLSEASKMWISSLTRHNCSIDRIRINAFTSDIMMEEMLSFEQISQLYNPISANAFMYNLFRRLYTLKAGSYFVSHNAGEKMSVISQAMPENLQSQAVDLKKMYPESIPIGIPRVIPWVPIDPNLLTQYHTFYERVPCTFHPPEQKKPKFMKAKKKKNKKK